MEPLFRDLNQIFGLFAGADPILHHSGKNGIHLLPSYGRGADFNDHDFLYNKINFSARNDQRRAGVLRLKG
jgi:hypothetical protein